MHRLLIADGDAAARESLRALLPWQRCGVETVAEADTYQAAARLGMELRPDAAFVSLRLGARWGCDLAGLWRRAGLRTAVCVISNSGENTLLLRAMRAGARDFLLRPVSIPEARAFLARALHEAEEDAPALLPAPDAILGDRALSPLAAKMLSAVRERLDGGPVTLTAIADSLGMNGKYLGQVFLRETGMTLSQYVTACRMERARQLLTGTREKVSAVAGMVGYSQLNRFYVHFRAYFGVSPGELRGGHARRR